MYQYEEHVYTKITYISRVNWKNIIDRYEICTGDNVLQSCVNIF